MGGGRRRLELLLLLQLRLLLDVQRVLPDGLVIICIVVVVGVLLLLFERDPALCVRAAFKEERASEGKWRWGVIGCANVVE